MVNREHLRNIMIPVFLMLYFFAIPFTSHAALLYFDPGEANVFRGDTVSIALRIDVDEGECINTIDAVIHYDDSVRAVDVTRGNSIFSLWVEDPKIDETAHAIRFAAGIPGGYCGRIQGDPSLTNEVVTLVFRSPGLSIGDGDKNKSARIWLDESSQVLLNDGLGTVASLMTQESHIILSDTPGSAPIDNWRSKVQTDSDEPSDFDITLVRDEVAFNNKYFITFNTQDKQTGIDHYEVMEEPFSEFYTFKWGRADAPWIIAQSPYILKDQTLNSTIRVKAIDKSGNQRIATLVPDIAQRSVSHNKIITYFIVAGISVLSLLLIWYVLFQRKKRLLETMKEE